MKKNELKYNNILIKGAKLNFQIFHTLKLDGDDLTFLHLVSSAISSGYLYNVCFYNASFLSTKFSEVIFEGCNLKNTDICSIWANNCDFRDTDFSNATISDSTFINCTFDEAIFENVSLTRCQFVNCIFEQFLIDDSTFSLNTFTQCTIKNTHLTESFYYQIFDNCTFYKVNMEAALLGFNFGFSSKTVAQLTEGIDLTQIKEDFIGKGLYINAALLCINQVQNYYDEAIIACVTAMGQMIQHDILIKADEIEFIKKLTSYFQDHKKIAPISILRIWQLLNNYLSDYSPNISINKAMPLIREYENMLYFNFMDFQKMLQERLASFSQIRDIIDAVELKIIYYEKPTLPLLSLLTKFHALSEQDSPMPKLIYTKNGSFIELHEITTLIIPYLQTFFALVGVIVPIVIYKKQKQDYKQEEKAEIETKKNLEIEITLTSEKANQSPILLPNTVNITPTTNIMISDVIKILKSQPMMNCTDFCGYNAQNVQSITIRFH